MASASPPACMTSRAPIRLVARQIAPQDDRQIRCAGRMGRPRARATSAHWRVSLFFWRKLRACILPTTALSRRKLSGAAQGSGFSPVRRGSFLQIAGKSLARPDPFCSVVAQPRRDLGAAERLQNRARPWSRRARWRTSQEPPRTTSRAASATYLKAVLPPRDRRTEAAVIALTTCDILRERRSALSFEGAPGDFSLTPKPSGHAGR